VGIGRWAISIRRCAIAEARAGADAGVSEQHYLLVPAFSATPQCGIEAFDESMTVDRLAKEGDGTGRLSSLANSLFGKGGNEDDRYIRTAYGQLVL